MTPKATMARAYHSGSSSSDSSYASEGSSRSGGSRRTADTAITSYSDHSNYDKQPKFLEPEIVEEPADFRDELTQIESCDTYASTLDFEDACEPTQRGPMPRRRRQLYEPDSVPASTHDFARLFPSTRRFMIQHDDTAPDGNLQLRLDTETSQTSSRRMKKVTLFHLRMKNLKEREFSLRRYCRDSGREVASSKKKYIKSTVSTPLDHTPSPQSTKHTSQRLSDALHHLASKPHHTTYSDSGYGSDEDEDECDRHFEETLRTITAPSEEVISTPTNSIKLDFSNYAQVNISTERTAKSRLYSFDYWGHNYQWKREKHLDDGEVVYSYELYRQGSRKRVAVIMPDALGAEEAQWEAKQGGWIPACSMRLLQQDVSDHLGDVIIATGLVTLADDCIRRHFNV